MASFERPCPRRSWARKIVWLGIIPLIEKRERAEELVRRCFRAGTRPMVEGFFAPEALVAR
jgi:hypothetical protein